MENEYTETVAVIAAVKSMYSSEILDAQQYKAYSWCCKFEFYALWGMV